jgi:hypothetical protein
MMRKKQALIDKLELGSRIAVYFPYEREYYAGSLTKKGMYLHKRVVIISNMTTETKSGLIFVFANSNELQKSLISSRLDLGWLSMMRSEIRIIMQL